MGILNVEHLNHGFGDRAIFHDVSLRLLKGEHIDLTGANGERKSTLMNITMDRLIPDEGKVEWAKNVRVGYLDQHTALEKGMTVRDVLKSAFAFLFEMEEQMGHICSNMGSASKEEMNTMMEGLGTIQDLPMAHDFYTTDSKMGGTGRVLGLNNIGMDKDVTGPPEGRGTKALLGKLLLQKPDILLLDKPINYLDTVHIERLKCYLQEYENAFIPTFHDIPSLNSVINLTYHVENQSLDRHAGNYDRFQEVYTAKEAQLKAAHKRQQQEISELEDFVARNKVRAATRSMATSRQRKLDKIGVIEPAREGPKSESHFLNARITGKYIFEITDLIIGYDEPPSRPLSLVMEYGQRVVLVGTNNVRKTTLLKNILSTTPTLSRSVELGDYLSIGYFEQKMAPGNTNVYLEEIWKGFPSYTQYRVHFALAKCGLITKHIGSQVRVLDGGEQAKVRLCRLINRESNVLLLDEPTNHLDVDAKEGLRQTLKEYKGNILLTCHEPKFYEGLATNVWGYKEWALRLS